MPISDIISYINRKRLNVHESSSAFTLQYCPACPPHKNRSDNKYKLIVFKDSGNIFCHRCGLKGSFYDLKRAFGDLQADAVSVLRSGSDARTTDDEGVGIANYSAS
eukprot:GHVU01169178.1.p1 GENE.GHVU01169178.1~~GHVU01169178.1.p1  ORF type:complete len:106 (+),score=3.61 GHVU01169178.1:538-855(+)